VTAARLGSPAIGIGATIGGARRATLKGICSGGGAAGSAKDKGAWIIDFATILVNGRIDGVSGPMISLREKALTLALGGKKRAPSIVGLANIGFGGYLPKPNV
jgi:hypothetical protein